MAIPANAVRCSLVGHLGPDEIFDTSFWTLGDNCPTSAADANSYAAAIAGYFESEALDEAVAFITDDSGYDQCRIYAYPTGGPHATFVGAAIFDANAGTADNPLPLQSCLVVTLRTALTGRSHRGRMYVPVTGGVLDDTHKVSSAGAGGLATAWAAFLSGVAGDPTLDTPVVVSQTLSSGTIITAVSVDERIDIQRRRANRQATGTAQVVALT